LRQPSLAGDGEAEAVAGSAGVESDEAFEDALALVFGYAGPVIRDERLDTSVLAPELHVDSAGGLDGGEGVVDEVAEDAFERVGVAAHGGVVVGGERDGRVRRTGLSVFNERACDRREVDRCPGRVCFEPGESEEVVDQAAQSFAVAGDGVIR
jgi:hypothetical protein